MISLPAKLKTDFGLLLLIFFLFNISICYSQTTKVLFIGSSLTWYNNLPGMFSQLASAAGKDVLAVNGAVCGRNLTDHLSISATMDKLNQEEYDYVVLENGDYNLMYADTKAEAWNAIDTFIDMIHSHCAATKIIVFMDWAMKNGVVHNNVYYTYDEFTQIIYNATMDVARSKNLIVAPIGVAWNDIVKNQPEYELYAPDNGHPSLSGSYLGACVYYSIIFQESVEGNSFMSSLSECEASYLQEAASNTVLNNLELWQVITSVEKNNIDNNEIDKSFVLYQNYPNPFNPSTAIQYIIPAVDALSSVEAPVTLIIYDVLGKQIATLVNETQPAGTYSVTFDASLLPSGVYFYTLQAGNYYQTKKMIIIK